jgi:TfoX/Sxy family transcriptional regulator of competence genes
MSTEDDLSARVRAALAGAGTIREVKMFGGIGFMLNGNMVVGVFRGGLLVRVGKDQYGKALHRPGARPMEMRGRAMQGYVLVDPPLPNDRAIKTWIEMASNFVQTLPPKGPAKPTRTKGTRK